MIYWKEAVPIYKEREKKQSQSHITVFPVGYIPNPLISLFDYTVCKICRLIFNDCLRLFNKESQLAFMLIPSSVSLLEFMINKYKKREESSWGNTNILISHFNPVCYSSSLASLPLINLCDRKSKQVLVGCFSRPTSIGKQDSFTPGPCHSGQLLYMLCSYISLIWKILKLF